MPRFQFSISSHESVREAGVVHSDSFSDALAFVGRHVTATRGDTLEIGVKGFPPARFECVNTILDGDPLWAPANELAA